MQCALGIAPQRGQDEREYCRKLERSFDARLRCDRGRHSEPLMLRELFMHWIDAGLCGRMESRPLALRMARSSCSCHAVSAGAPRGKAMGTFARTWSVIPKKFEAAPGRRLDASCLSYLFVVSDAVPGKGCL